MHNGMNASVVLSLIVASCTHHATSAVGAPGAPGTLPAPQPGLAVYDGDATIDPATGGVQARWRISFVRDGGLADTVRLRLNRGLRVSTVSGPAVADDSVTVAEDVQMVTVALAPAPRGSPAVLEIAYTGMLVAPSDGINRIAPDWVELGADSFWQPIFASFDQAIIGQLRLRLPAGFQVAAPGVVQRLDDSTYLIDGRVPIPDVPFSASRSLAMQEHGDTRVYYTGPKPILVDPLLRTTEDCASYLNSLYGRSARLPARTMVLAPREGGGYARKNYIVIPGADTTPTVLSRFVCHELAHFWSSRANPSGPDNWLNEGVAEFVSAQYVRTRIGAPAYDTIVSQWRTVGEGQPAVWTPTSTRRPNALISYRKAPYLLTQLEARIGPDRMQRVLQRYMTQPMRTTPELIAMIGEVTDSATADWFRDLLSR